jgi:hypothetical protein
MVQKLSELAKLHSEKNSRASQSRNLQPDTQKAKHGKLPAVINYRHQEKFKTEPYTKKIKTL